MTERDQKVVILNGAIVLLAGNLLGFPLGMAVTGNATPETIHAWTAAHTGVTAGGVMLIAIGAALRHVVLGSRAASWLLWSLLATGYGAIVGLGLGAAAGVRGLSPTGPALNFIAFLGNLAIVWGSIVGVALVIWGAYKALSKPAR